MLKVGKSVPGAETDSEGLIRISKVKKGTWQRSTLGIDDLLLPFALSSFKILYGISVPADCKLQKLPFIPTHGSTSV